MKIVFLLGFVCLIAAAPARDVEDLDSLLKELPDDDDSVNGEFEMLNKFQDENMRASKSSKDVTTKRDAAVQPVKDVTSSKVTKPANDVEDASLVKAAESDKDVSLVKAAETVKDVSPVKAAESDKDASPVEAAEFDKDVSPVKDSTATKTSVKDNVACKDTKAATSVKDEKNKQVSTIVADSKTKKDITKVDDKAKEDKSTNEFHQTYDKYVKITDDNSHPFELDVDEERPNIEEDEERPNIEEDEDEDDEYE